MSNQEQVAIFARLLYALVIGAAIGFERELRGHEAGLRTSSLVCLGAAVFGEVSAVLATDRVSAGVVQGIGFLGAGIIFQRRGAVVGVTSAATLWVVASLGLMIALNLWLTVLLITIVIVALLELSPLSDFVYRFGKRHPWRPERTNDDIT